MSWDFDEKAGKQKPEDVRGVLAPGTRLRTYAIVSSLGQGGFGITYLARDTQLARDVAIKEYLPTSLALREDGTLVVPRSTEHAEQFVWGRERFLDEARTLAKLEDTPGIVRDRCPSQRGGYPARSRRIAARCSSG
jgi:serine/threonine protein kinase